MPPLPDITWLSFIKYLLQDYESVMPVLEFVDLPLLDFQLPTISGKGVERHFPTLAEFCLL
jgi:hypothetical protein